MPDDLYDRDALAWSERQAALLRRVARGERVNDVDWDHVVEEIEDVGLSELNTARSFVQQMLVHLLKLQVWPGLDACRHWRSEIVVFQSGAEDRFAPSMRQRIDLAKIYARARKQVDLLRFGADPGLASPEVCPVTLDRLLGTPVEDLEAAFATAKTG
jgi:hypothetical protein